MTERIVIDIWGGPLSQEHLARFLKEIDEALQLARQALLAGFLVNLRSEIAWGDEEEFDNRADLQ